MISRRKNMEWWEDVDVQYQIGREEEADYLEEQVRVRRDELRRRVEKLERNDPRILSVEFEQGDGETIDWERFGVIIGRNTHLEELVIDVSALISSTHVAAHVFQGLALN